MGLNSLQNTVGKGNLEKLKRLNFGMDQMLERSKKKKSLGLKMQTESRGCMRTARQKKISSKKMRLLNILMASSGATQQNQIFKKGPRRG